MKTSGITTKIVLPIIIFMLVVSALAILMTILKKDPNYILSVFSITILLMMLFVMIIIKKNLVGPIEGIMFRINRGECATPTGIDEVDELVYVVNDALATAELKNLQTAIFHKIAVSLNRDVTIEKTESI